jgi:hypothetical protein
MEEIMKTKRSFSPVILLICAAIVLAGCASPTAEASTVSIPTSVPLTCPTTEPLSCPTPLAQLPPAPDEWRQGWSNESEVVITFDPGDKCSVDVKSPITEPGWFYEVVVNDTTYQNYVVIAMTLEDGKTLKDLEEYHKTPAGSQAPPPFAKMIYLNIVPAMSSTLNAVEYTGDPLYFSCIVEGPGPQKVIDEFGPVEVAKQ